MFDIPRALVGREPEVQALARALEQTRQGRGSVWLLAGEPGIGKTRVAEEIAQRALASGAAVYWGRCWEAGGAPAYWPWIQILRQALGSEAHPALAPHLRHLAQLLPELGARRAAATDPLPLAPEQARFQLLDSVVQLLRHTARRQPLVLLLEDLHAADPSSLVLLEFLSGQVQAMPLLVLATHRDPGALGAAATHLGAVKRQAHTIALRRLRADDVNVFLEHALGHATDASVAAAIYEVTEGNPLFVGEITRLLSTQGGVETVRQRGVTVPGSVHTVIRERLAGLSPKARTLLSIASVHGREFGLEAVSEASDIPRALAADTLVEAIEAAVLTHPSPDVYRFSHILMREVLYRDLPDARRHELHRAAARRLTVDGASVSERAHHLLRAGSGQVREAIEACEQAARHALDQLAFDEAVDWYERALAALRDTEQGDGRPRCELLLGQGHARILAGETERGQRACLEAAQLARGLDDAQLLARAALQYGTAFVFASVDPRLVALLQEALDALGREDSRLRALVMARLAAAQQPALDPRQPFALARDAITMARRLGHKPTLLSTIRAACSALMDLAPPEERSELNREHIRLAEELDDRVEMWRGSARLTFDRFELGDLAGATAAIEQCARIADELDHPAYVWPVRAFQAIVANFFGRFDEAERIAAEAEASSQRAGDPNAPRSLLMHRMGMLRTQGRYDELAELLPRAQGAFRGVESVELLGRMLLGADLLRLGRRQEAMLYYSPDDVEMAIRLGDATLLEALTDLVAMADDPALANKLHDALLPYSERMIHGGMTCMTWSGPASQGLAVLARAAGLTQKARQHFEHALARVEAFQAVPHIGWICARYGGFLAERGEPQDTARARELLGRAIDLARTYRMPALLEQAEAALGSLGAQPAEAPARAEPGFSMRCEGEYWTFEVEGATFRLKQTKGLHMLSRLVEEPEREFHVLELSGSSPAADRGDAGAVLDARARDEYQRRLSALRDEIEEAEQWNDTARAERARSELDFLSVELSRSLGLGGRGRRNGSASERARVNVQRRLRDAVRRIEAHSETLGRYLSQTVRTGTFCSYRPR